MHSSREILILFKTSSGDADEDFDKYTEFNQ